MRVVAFLPVKGTSTRVENKNIRPLDGKPLFLHTLQKLAKCDFIDEVYLDSESEEIFQLASEVDCTFFKRSEDLATNKTDGNALFYNEVSNVEADIYIQILCTSPFIEIDTIKKGVELLKADTTKDSVVLIKREKQYTWDPNTESTNYDLDQIPNSYDLDDTLIETMGLYIVRKEVALKNKKRIGEHPILLNASPSEAVDVNYPEDFTFANLLAAGIREQERKLLANLSKQLTSSMLSDILDDLEIENKVITGLKLNLENKKIFGRAKTLKIKAKEETDTNTIYDALETYSTIVPNDIICVENELPQFAYFGELNTNLAIRSGALGTIIGGKTRDHKAVMNLDYPVFSQGYSCKDIKHNGTVASYNKKININNVEINYEDLIFADSDGIVVIPKDKENQILDACTQIISNENSILIEVAKGMSIENLRSRFNDF